MSSAQDYTMEGFFSTFGMQSFPYPVISTHLDVDFLVQHMKYIHNFQIKPHFFIFPILGYSISYW